MNIVKILPQVANPSLKSVQKLPESSVQMHPAANALHAYSAH